MAQTIFHKASFFENYGRE